MKHLLFFLFSGFISNSLGELPTHICNIEKVKYTQDTTHPNYSGIYCQLENDGTAYTNVIITAYGDKKGNLAHHITWVSINDVAAKPEVSESKHILIDPKTGISNCKNTPLKFVKAKGYSGFFLENNFYIKLPENF